MFQNRERELETAVKYRQVIGTNHSSNKLRRRFLDCQDRRDSNELFLMIQRLRKGNEGSLKKCNNEIHHLHQALHNLHLEHYGSVCTEGNKLGLAFAHDSREKGCWLDTKSVRRPLVHLSPRNHGIQVRVKHELLSKACAVPHRIRAKIVRREAVRLSSGEKLKLWQPDGDQGMGILRDGQVDPLSSSVQSCLKEDDTKAASNFMTHRNEEGEFLCSTRKIRTTSTSKSSVWNEAKYPRKKLPKLHRGKERCLIYKGKTERNIPQITITTLNGDGSRISDEWVAATPPSDRPEVAIEVSQPVGTKTCPKPLSVFELQTIVNDNILHPTIRDISSKQKTRRLANYVRILSEHLGADVSPNLTKADLEYLKVAGRGDSPDFTGTPFINVGKNALIEREKEEHILKMVAKPQWSSLVVLRNKLSGIPAMVNFPETVDDGTVQRINARLPASAVGSAAGVVVLNGKRDRFRGLQRHHKDTTRNLSSF